jgi:hypothetical protein
VAFDDTPAAAASIGQVHRGRWRDDGGQIVEVAVKVQYPGVGKALRTALVDGWSRCRHQLEDPSWARLKRRRRPAMTAQSTVLHIPSLAAAVTCDLSYNQVHMMTATS